ncbi:MAG TPA: lipoyl(octanoyl) transferase LipB [Candidatus Binatia bacterium]|nr:lipoyl(octanoyl) transferase LipB [Candidatus Binatia bacterium]
MDEPILTAVPAPGPTGRGDEARAPAGPLSAVWLGRVAYRPAWALQKRLAAERAAGRVGDCLLLLEHEPVLTLGRHADPSHVLVPPEVLARRGIDLVRVERGGEVTYHGPGQLVAYPIVALADRGIGIRAFVRILEAALAATCAAFGVEAGPRAGHPGCWCDPDGPLPRKVGALGLRVERGVTYHGIALNVDLDLAPFDLIDPCGLPGLRSTSIAAELARVGRRDPAPSIVEAAWHFAHALAEGLGTELAPAPPNARFVRADGGAAAGIDGGQDWSTEHVAPAVGSPDDVPATSGGPDAVRRARAG